MTFTVKEFTLLTMVNKMKINVCIGSRQEDKVVLHFSYWTMFGLGNEKTIALYYTSTNVLEIIDGHARKLDKILDALRKYQTKEMKRFRGSLDFVNKPVSVIYW